MDVREGVTGDADGSELVRRINSHDPDQVMPPPATKKRLSAVEKRRLQRWVAAGAVYSEH